MVVWGARVRDGSWVPPILRWPAHSNLREDRLRQSTWNEDWRIYFQLFIIINLQPWIRWSMCWWMQYNCLHPGQISVAFQPRVERVCGMSPTSRHHEAVRLYEERGHRYQDSFVLLNNRLDGHLSKEGIVLQFFDVMSELIWVFFCLHWGKPCKSFASLESFGRVTLLI